MNQLITVSKFKNPNINLALKQIECLDINSAKKALEELKVFHQLDHRFLCKLKDSYLTWDPKISSIYVSYWMEFYEGKTLLDYIDDKRLKREFIPLKLVKQLLGNMVEALFYLHDVGIIHRNIHPGSFYMLPIDEEEFRLILGDYYTKSLAKDARTKTKVRNNNAVYIAPEVLDALSFSFKSDIWSLGTTLVDICTTSLFDKKELHSNLNNIKHDNKLKDGLLNAILEVYESKSLVNIISLLLNTSVDKRINIRSLANNEFIQECLELIDSQLVQFTQTSQEEKHSIKINVENEPQIFTDLSELEQYLAANNKEYQNFDNKIQLLFLELMKAHSNNEKIQQNLFKLIEDGLNSTSTNNKHVIHKSFFDQFFYIFLKYSQNKEIQIYGVKSLIHLSNFDQISNQLANHDFIDNIFGLLKNFDSDSLLCGYICKLIWFMSTNGEVLKILMKKNCLDRMKNVINSHKTNEFCTEMAIKVVIAMCINERLVAEQEFDVDVLSTIIEALQYHLQSNKIVISACIAFSALISFNEESAFRFLFVQIRDNGVLTNLNGIDLLKKAYSMHKDEGQLVESICDVFKELSNYDETVVEMHSLKLNETLLYDISKRYRDNDSVAEKCQKIISKIEAKNKESSE